MSASPELLSLPPSVTVNSAARNIVGGNREKINKNESLNKKKNKIVDTKTKSSVKLAKGSRSPRTVVRKIDEEWGVPVYEDCKLIEPLELLQASAELTSPEILYKRDKFR
ncbi:putative methyladenine glycosylase, DNA glycosylase [Helianthus anomalus]